MLDRVGRARYSNAATCKIQQLLANHDCATKNLPLGASSSAGDKIGSAAVLVLGAAERLEKLGA